jgi:hypothetical protein
MQLKFQPVKTWPISKRDETYFFVQLLLNEERNISLYIQTPCDLYKSSASSLWGNRHCCLNKFLSVFLFVMLSVSL